MDVLQDLFGAALIGMSALTFYARVMARASEFRPRADRRSPYLPPAGHAGVDPLALPAARKQ